MNKVRRKELGDVIRDLGALQDKDDLQSCINTLDYIKDDEQDYYDNIPENLQYSIRAEDSEKAIDCLDDALSYLNQVYEAAEFNKDSSLIQKAIDKIDDARW